MSRDNLLIVRPYSQGTLVTAGETAGDATNSRAIPPGMYDVEVSASSPGGGAVPTGITATIKEKGYLWNKPAGDTGAALGWVALRDPRARTGTFAPASASGTVRMFLRGVVIARWNDGAPNAGVDVIPAGGTTPNIGKVQVTFWPDGRSPQYNGLP